MVKFETITGPSFAASYLVNGDATGITDQEQAQVDAWCRREGIAFVVGIEDDSERFTWSYALYFPEAGCSGGDVLDYICELKN